MKITIYELLGLIKDGKAPKKFIYDNQLFILDEEDNVYRSHLGNRFGAMYQLDIKLNNEIEILEGTLEEENERLKEELDNLKPLKEAREQVIEYVRRKNGKI